jgi:hypothetical protein
VGIIAGGYLPYPIRTQLIAIPNAEDLKNTFPELIAEKQLK